MTRLELEAGIGFLLLLALAFAWQYHNKHERNLGAQACVASTTETRALAQAGNVVDESSQAETLKKVVAIYEKKLSDASRGNAAIARGMRVDEVRSRSLPNSPAARCALTSDAGLSASEGRAQASRESALVALLNACDANQLRTEGLAAAYESARIEALEAQKKPAK